MPTDAEPMHDLVVSIINYRTAALTMDCVRSVLADLATASGIDARIVVVDNASGDGSVAVLRDWIASLTTGTPVDLVASARNTGFSGGHNQGIGAARARFYLVLNSDAVLKPGFCAAMLQAAEERPKAGLFAPRIDYDGGPQQVSCFRAHGPASELMRGAAAGPISSLLKKHSVWLDMPPDPDQIEWASFAGIVLRGAMIDDVGPMDEGYFLYFEDTEYCVRARRAGWGIVYVPEARMVHFRGGSAPVKSLAKARKRLPPYYYASRTRMLYQTHGWGGLILANLGWHLGRAIAVMRGLVGKKRPGIEAEWRDIWTNVLTPLGDRRAPGE